MCLRLCRQQWPIKLPSLLSQKELQPRFFFGKPLIKPSFMAIRMCSPTYKHKILCVPACFFVSVCNLYLCLRLLQRGSCQGSWEGSKGEVINQDRQTQHPGVPRMTVSLGAAGPSAQIPLWSEHQLRNRAAPLLSRGREDNLLFPRPYSAFYEARAQEHLCPA